MTAAQTLRPHGQGRFVFICDHASNHIPAELNQLGLPASVLQEHVAWDIGAAGVTRVLSEQLDSPAILCGTSRLVIDCNRQPENDALIPAIAHGIPVPGNAALSPAARKTRLDRWFHPYHNTIEAILTRRIEQEPEPIVIAIHSMTPLLGDMKRPWSIALSSDTDRRLTDPVLAALRASLNVQVGDNEPYSIEPLVDYSIPFHALRRQLNHLQVEFRQDEIATATRQRQWALRFAAVLRECAL